MVAWQVPGDGRELVVAVPDAVTVRAEDGRRVEATDISPFISNLPFGAYDIQALRHADSVQQHSTRDVIHRKRASAQSPFLQSWAGPQGLPYRAVSC